MTTHKMEGGGVQVGLYVRVLFYVLLPIGSSDDVALIS